MKKIFITSIFTVFIFLIFAEQYCNASENNSTFTVIPSLKDGSATYDQVLAWSKQKIQNEAEKDHTSAEIASALQDFPVKTEEQCDQMKLLFIKNSPQCGNINCSALIFKQTTDSTYQYIGDVTFAAVRLFCFPEKNATHYYLITNVQESNSESTLQLNEISNNTLLPKGTHHLDYTNDNDNKVADDLWEKKIDESHLLNMFK